MMQLTNADNLYLGLPGGDFYSNVSGISDGAWHHLVRTSNRTSGAEKIYLDHQIHHKWVPYLGMKSHQYYLQE